VAITEEGMPEFAACSEHRPGAGYWGQVNALGLFPWKISSDDVDDKKDG
jgi:hypothetical protein